MTTHSREETTAKPSEATLVSRSRKLPELSMPAFLRARDPPRVHWAAPDGLELAGSGVAARLVADGADRFERIRDEAADLFSGLDHEGPAATRPRAIGGVAFDPNHEPHPPWEGFPSALFVVPRTLVTHTADATWLTVTARGPDATAETVEKQLDRTAATLSSLPVLSPASESPGVADTRPIPSRAEWTASVGRTTERIRRGDLEKVVLATALDVELDGPIEMPDVLEGLRRTYPECFRLLVQPTAAAGFFGPSPERLVRKRGRTVESEALAGSVARGETPEEDADLAATLLDRSKLQHEQGVVVETIREALAAFGSVTVGDQGVRKLSNIQHLRTPITADLTGEAHVLDVVAALHPTPAVGGLPTEIARETIRECEGFDRGWYAAPVGWFDGAGDGEFAVGIRTGVAGGTRARLFAGNGIVADSDPDEEWAEIQHKYRPILDELR